MKIFAAICGMRAGVTRIEKRAAQRRGMFDVISQEKSRSLRVPIVRIAHPRQMPPFRRRRAKRLLPSHSNVMRLARVIIKLKSGRELVEFLAADNLRVSFPRPRQSICAETTGINGALTNRARWLTIP
jgi:hypothetical protein